MEDHRLVASTALEIAETHRPFSNFDFVEKHFGGTPSIRRLFSQARAQAATTLVVEDIPASGVIASENVEISQRFGDYSMGALKRLTFWRGRSLDLDSVDSTHLLGFAIAKRDLVPSRGVDRWHVFESAFASSPREHSYLHGTRAYQVVAGQRRFSVAGVLYCQQNALNKACAQVALRSLCALHVPDTEVSYERINLLARKASGTFDPAKGLGAVQIRAVLQGVGIGFRDVDYTAEPPKYRKELPYQKLLYAGIESGAGALLGFSLAGPKAAGLHMIPFFGHTSNQDAWVPKAETAYFHVGEHTRYVPSEAWVSSFIGHDDNFGSNFCVPRLYVTSGQVDYVVALLPSGARYCGVVAEAIAVDYLYSILPSLSPSDGRWLARLIESAERQDVVLRAVWLTKAKYIRHLRRMTDWSYRREDKAICDALEKYLPSDLWMIEVSAPELFPANQRKLGEIVLDATTKPAAHLDFKTFLFARFPGRFLLLENPPSGGRPLCVPVRSRLHSHTPLWSEAS